MKTKIERYREFLEWLITPLEGDKFPSSDVCDSYLHIMSRIDLMNELDLVCEINHQLDYLNLEIDLEEMNKINQILE